MVSEFIHMDADVTQGKKCVRYIWRCEGVENEEVKIKWLGSKSDL